MERQVLEINTDEKIEIKPEVTLSNILETVGGFIQDYGFVEVKQEEDMTIKYEEPVEKIKQEELIIENESDDNPADASSEENFDEDQNEMYSDNSDSEGRRKVSWNSELKLHTGKKLFSCEVCGNVFTQNSSLKHHMRIHTGEKPYTCDDCGKTFTRASLFNHHMRIHTEEKSYVCGVCSKNCIHTSKLIYHMRMHPRDQPRICGVCSQAFIDAHQLKYNTRKHTGKKPYVCGVCTKAFSYSNHLKNHTKIHTGENLYCEICEKRFSLKVSLVLHNETTIEPKHKQIQTSRNAAELPALPYKRNVPNILRRKFSTIRPKF